MHKMIGDRRVFAVEIDADDTDPFGTVWFWYSDVRRGTGKPFHLIDLAEHLKRLVKDNGDRLSDALWAIPSVDAFKWIEGIITDDEKLQQRFAGAGLPEDVARFSLWFHHVLGGKLIVLVGSGLLGKLITEERQQIVVVQAPLNSFESVIVDSYHTILSLSRSTETRV